MASSQVKHMRSKYGDYFGITVVGYPESHPDMIKSNGVVTLEGYHSDIAYLKQKIPAEVMSALEPIKDNEEAVKAYGIHLGTEMCKKILANGIKTLHLYTLNMDKTALAILMNLGLIEESKISRSLPWRHSTNVFRSKEDVRPIFWENRPKSYISKTTGWEQYPCGRWGDSCNASYGALTNYQGELTKTYDEAVKDGCEESVADTQVVLKNFGRTTRLLPVH